MIKIRVNNNKCQLENIGVPTLRKLRAEKSMAIRVPGAYFSKAFSNRKWDGKFYCISERGLFDTGKLFQVTQILESYGKKFKIVDERNGFKPKYKVNRLRTFTLYPYQKEAVNSLLKNKVAGVDFPIGFIKAATNAGKTLISAAIHRSYNRKTLFIINSQQLLKEALKEIPQYLPGEVGMVAANKIEWNNFTIVMVKTAVNRLPQIINKLKEYDVAIIDEADLSTSKTYTQLIRSLFHCYVRVGLSGTQFTKLAKDKVKREKVRGIFGENIFEITNKQLIDLGKSSKVEVTIVNGNLEYELERRGDWKDEYDMGITRNVARHERILERVYTHLERGHTPMLIFCQFHEHIKNVYDILYEAFEDHPTLRIARVHHKTEQKDYLVEQFRKGYIDILVGSMILKRGKNFPLTRYILNAGGGDSFTNVLQGPIGRAVRKHESKEVTYIEDMYDQGIYLRRHSNHRRIAYKNEGFKVIEKYKE